MTDDELHRAYAAYRATATPATWEGRDRPTLDDMQRLVEGAVPHDQTEALLGRVLSDADTARELALLGVVSRARAPQHWRPAHWWTMAAAVLIASAAPLLWQSRVAGREQVFRATNRETAALKIIAPREPMVLAPGARVTWNSLHDADRYVVELVSERGDAVARIVSLDTTVLLPDSIPAARLRDVAGLMVIARLRDGGERQSPLRLTAKRTP